MMHNRSFPNVFVTRFRKLLALSLFFQLLNASAEASEKISIVTSIKPIALIVKELVGSKAMVAPLLNSGSAHHMTLKASQLKLVNNADLFIWIGPQLEGDIKNAAAKARHQLLLIESSHGPVPDHHHHHDENDPHLWITPESAQQISKTVAAKLAELSILDKGYLGERLALFEEQLVKTDKDIHALIDSRQPIPFVAYHNGYSRFVEAYNLNQIHALTYSPDQLISAKKLAEVKVSITDARCMIATPDELPLADRFSKKLGIKLVGIDLLALNKQTRTYREYLMSLAKSFVLCAT